jgi:glucosylceramidase
MKTNGQMNFGGKLKDEYKESWANYYCKFIEHYEDEKIPIWGVSVQNEPEAKQTWDSCLYTAEEERDFIKSFLGPALESRGMSDKKLIIWDHNRDLMVERARTVLKDPLAAKYVWGTGFHWYNGDHFDNVQKVHDEFPDKELIFTEGCQEGGPHIGSWDLGERYATSIINDLNRWTVAWIDWNLILDELGGPNHAGNFCSAPIIVDTKSQEILYQSSYYYMGHFSRFLKPGDQIVDSDSTNNNLLVLSSISTSKNSIQTVVLNKQSSPEYFRYMRDDTMFGFSIPERSIITIVDRLKF